MLSTRPVATHLNVSSPGSARARWTGTAIALTLTLLVLLAIAALTEVLSAGVWLIALGVAVVAGIVATPMLRRTLILALVPATLLTNSDIVPFSGRYVPAVTVIVAIMVASRGDMRELPARIKSLPRGLLMLLAAYAGLLLITTVTSTERELSLAYLVGSAVTLTLAFIVVPFASEGIGEDLIATLVVTAVVIVLCGVVFALVGSFELYGRAVGLYFITEATVFGHPTGLIFFQDYGPFLGPETLPLALGVVGATYLRSRSANRMRLAWTAAAAVILIGLISTFSREGWLIVVVAGIAVAWALRRNRDAFRPAAALAGVMLVLFFAGVSNAFGVIGRMDLVTDWYGPNAPAILLNPSVTDRGQAQTATHPYTASPQQRTLSQPCVAVEAPGAAGGSTASVELKGYSSLLARLCLWETAVKAIAARPLVGFGPGTGADAIVPYFEGKGAGLSGATTHDTYLRVGVEMGIPGLLVYIALSALAAWFAIRWLWLGVSRAEIVLAAAVLAITVAELTDALLFGGLSFPGFWLAMSVGLLARVDRLTAAESH